LRTTGKVQTTNQTKTVADLFDKYYSTQAVTTLKRPDAYKQIIDHDIIPSIGHENLVSLEHRRYLLSDIVDRAITRGATTHANKIRSLLKRTFKWAYQRGYIHYDPTIALEKSAYNGIKDNSREVALDTTSGEANEELTEIPRLFKALDDNKRLSQQVRTGAKLLLLTGLRVSELRLAKRSDLADNILTIPIGNQKLPPRLLPSAKPFHVPLSTYAMHLLKEPSGTFLLGGEKPISDKAIGRAIKRLQASGKLKTREFEARDLRRTFRTHIGSLGVPLEVAESCLNHKQPVIIRTYDTQSYLPQRGEALQVWSDRVEMAVTNYLGE
jgi:integrase